VNLGPKKLHPDQEQHKQEKEHQIREDQPASLPAPCVGSRQGAGQEPQQERGNDGADLLVTNPWTT